MRDPRNPNPNNMERSHDHTKERHHMSTPISVPRNSKLTENRASVGPSSNSTNVTNKPTSKPQIPLNTMHKHPSTHMKIIEKIKLQRAPEISQISGQRPEPLTCGGQGRPKKRKQSEMQTLSGPAVTTVTELEQLLDTCTDTHFAKVIQDLPATWQSHNLNGELVTKRMLNKTTWGAYRDDHIILSFQQAILSTKPHPQTITQYDTQMAQSTLQHNDV